MTFYGKIRLEVLQQRGKKVLGSFQKYSEEDTWDTEVNNKSISFVRPDVKQLWVPR